MASMADYEELKSLYKRDGMEVLLVCHRTLKETRILKRIRKNEAKAGFEKNQLQQEARILPKLTTPAVPVIYDFWEDENTICLIEEYVQGVSLREYFLYHSKLTLMDVMTMIIQICEVICHLHAQNPPILYQDLKPEHLILRKDQIVLIDYGIARQLEKGERYKENFGSVGYASPEQMDGSLVDERSDLYALGKLAEEMLLYTEGRIPVYISRIVRKALCKDPQGRPESVDNWKQSWEKALAKKQHGIKGSKKGENRIRKEIAVIGNEHGIGTTHVACCLTATLRSCGHTAFYVNRSGKAVLVPVLRQRKEFWEKNGIIYHRKFAGIMDYGPAVIQTMPPDGIRVVDCGCDWQQAKEAELVIYVIGSRPWQDQEVMQEKVKMESCILLITPANQGVGHRLAKELGEKVYALPLEEDPITPGKTTRQVLKGLLRHAGIV